MSKSTKGGSPDSEDASRTVERTFVMENTYGLHARPADLLVKALAPFRAEVRARSGRDWTDARSILGLLGLAVGCQSKVTFTAIGADATQAIAAIEHLFVTQFDEAYDPPAPESRKQTDSKRWGQDRSKI